MKKSLLLLPIALTLTVGGLALAQSVDGELDLESIRARAGEFTTDAETLATNVRSRADALKDDAITSQSGAHENREAYMQSITGEGSGEPLDFDAMIRAQVDAERAGLGEAPRFIAFASLSMPEASLKALVQDMSRAGGVTVLRGFPAGDGDSFKRQLARIWSDGSETGSLGIDPRLFRAFDIKSAPSFVMLGGDFSPCDGFDCNSQVPPHDRLEGNVSVAHVLETFAAGNGPGARLAQSHITKLEGDRP